MEGVPGEPSQHGAGPQVNMVGSIFHIIPGEDATPCCLYSFVCLSCLLSLASLLPLSRMLEGGGVSLSVTPFP